MLNSKKLVELKKDLAFRTETFRDLAKKYGVNEVTIRRYNVKWNGRRCIDHAGIESELRRGVLTRERIAEIYDVSVRTVYNIKKRLNLVKSVKVFKVKTDK